MVLAAVLEVAHRPRHLPWNGSSTVLPSETQAVVAIAELARRPHHLQAEQTRRREAQAERRAAAAARWLPHRCPTAALPMHRRQQAGKLSGSLPIRVKGIGFLLASVHRKLKRSKAQALPPMGIGFSHVSGVCTTPGTRCSALMHGSYSL